MVIQVAKYGCPIWKEILDWEINAQLWQKQYLKDRLSDYLIKSMNDSNRFSMIFQIAQKAAKIKQVDSMIASLIIHELFHQ